MQGSFRIEGGLCVLCDRLADGIDPARRHLKTPVTALARTPAGITATLAGGGTVNARHVVCTMPPRVAATLAFSPALSPDATQALRAIPTWMAGQAKAVAVYDTPFWRAAGLSGDAMSQRGPMVEIHDASPAQGTAGALFGFLGVPPAQRTDAAALSDAVRAQFIRLFGPQAAHPRALEIKDWAFDPATATPEDHAPLGAHPRYGLPAALRNLWDGALLFGGTETAPHFGGFLEGALEAAENSFRTLADATR